MHTAEVMQPGAGAGRRRSVAAAAPRGERKSGRRAPRLPIPWPSRAIAMLCGGLLGAASIQAATHYAGNAARDSRAMYGPAVLDAPLWSAAFSKSPAAADEFIPLTTPVYCAGRVFVLGRVHDAGRHVATRLQALHAADGALDWASELPADVFESWSSPAVDVPRRLVIAAAGNTVRAVRVETGQTAWEVKLPRPVVNASPAISTGVGEAAPANRVYLTDYAPFSAGTLYAINLDPFHETENPFQPGELAWTAALGGTSGNSPAYADGLVACADTSGQIRAFEARAGGLLWARSAGGGSGFFGGVTIRAGAVYAATYNFSGGQNNSRLVKLRLADGELLWQIACERTNSVPIVTDESEGVRNVYLSGGIAGFGSVEKVQAFRDHGGSAVLVWDSHLHSGGARTIGGWTHQPLLVAERLFVGEPPGPGDFYGPYRRLHALDLRRSPDDPAFILSTHVGSGGSPACAGGRLFSLGAAAGETRLSAFAALPVGDLNCDGRVDFADIDGFVLALVGTAAYYEAYPLCAHELADANANGLVEFGDIDGFVQRLIEGGS